MRIDALTIVLRPRSSWEAVELGIALVRRHAGAIWRPWLALTLSLWVVLNAAGYVFDLLWLAPLLMWWLKPVFDRIPLYVLSRAVFGDVPDTRRTLREAFRGGGRAMLGYLTWRRLTPARSLLLPVDTLEGGDPAQAGVRRRVVAGPAYGVASLSWLMFIHFETALVLGFGAVVFLFVPVEYLRPSLELLWQHVRDSPAWLLLVENALVWIATTVLEPFYVGTGFGLYLNRRTEIEGWDIELAFRRMRERLLASGTVALLAIAMLGLPTAARAQAGSGAPGPPGSEAPVPPVRDERALQDVFGEDYVPPGRFDTSVEQAYEDPRLSPRRTVRTWKPRDADSEAPGADLGWLASLARVLGTVGELLLWALAALLVMLLLWSVRRWWPWLRRLEPVRSEAPVAPQVRVLTGMEPLPGDVAAAARRLWAAGRVREALSLVYRAAVESMRAVTGRPLPPGATEAQCLRMAGALPERQRAAFVMAVRQWQYAAYADRVPATAEFEAMLGEAAQAFGWPR